MAKVKTEEQVSSSGETREQSEADPFESLRGSGQEFRLSWQRTAPFHERGQLSPTNVAWSADAIDDVIPFMVEQFGRGSYLMSVKVPRVNGAGFQFLRHIPIDIASSPKTQATGTQMQPTQYPAPYAQQADPSRQVMQMLQPMLGAVMERLLQPAAPGAAPPIADVATLVQTLAGTVQRVNAPADPFDQIERVLSMVGKINQVTGRGERHASPPPGEDDAMPGWVAALLPLAERMLASRSSSPPPRPAGPPLPRGLSWDQARQRWVLAPGADVIVKRAENPGAREPSGEQIEETLGQTSTEIEGVGNDEDDGEEGGDAPIETADEALKEITAIVEELPEEEQRKLMAMWSAVAG